MGKVMLEAKNICKNFGSVAALRSVNFTLHEGEVHGLIGENGSGKSTLSSILAGVQPYTSGEITYLGEAYEPASALEANDKGIYMLLQERGTFENITVAANIFVGKEARYVKHGILNMREMKQDARAALDRIGADEIGEKELTGKLTFEQQKIVEIARAVNGNPRVLVVDETTTALSRKGRDCLYRQVEKLKESGSSVIFISHDIEEVKRICDTLTVLRDGQQIATLDKADFSDKKIRELMVGRDVGDNFYRTDRESFKWEDAAIRVEHLDYGILKDINLELYKGEILGIGGLTDCGMHDLGKAMFGILKPERGSVKTGNGVKINNERAAVAQKIAYVAKDRDTEALMTAGNIKDNLCAPSLKKLQKFGLITNRREREFAAKWAEKLNVKMSGLDQIVLQLSGGNKQKVSVAKWIGFDADVFIFDCPTRGIDIGVKAAIYQLLMQLKEEGKAILMISEELMEVIGMSDRVIIMKDGKVSGQFVREDELTEHKLIEYII